jgi:hypothetical protein
LLSECPPTVSGKYNAKNAFIGAGTIRLARISRRNFLDDPVTQVPTILDAASALTGQVAEPDNNFIRYLLVESRADSGGVAFPPAYCTST